MVNHNDINKLSNSNNLLSSSVKVTNLEGIRTWCAVHTNKIMIHTFSKL